MSNPQQPELRRSQRGGATAGARNPETVTRDTTANESPGPTPSANETEDERRSGTRSNAPKERDR